MLVWFGWLPMAGRKDSHFLKQIMAKKKTPELLEAKNKAVELLKQGKPSTEITFLTGIKRSALSDLRKKYEIAELDRGRKRMEKLGRKEYIKQEDSHYRFRGVVKSDSFIFQSF